MMKEINAVFKGVKETKYFFETDEAQKREMIFNKANKSLIEDFDLFGKESIGRLFRLKYFTEVISDRDIHILCDMERL